jgi:lipopolysaccharide biosynthesis glycosyltransferase
MMSAEPIRSPFRVFVGYDSREDIAFRVCEASLQRRTSIALEIRPIVQSELRTRGLYWRPKDPLASTEFTYTRFLTPYLAGYQGWALFCDCDFLWLDDIAKLAAMADPAKAVMCVHHDHRPTEATKMDGAVQTVYPRKNWSSLMLFNCGHPMTRSLTPEVVNTATGAHLHRMQWADDDAIGEVPATWNWLEGSMPKPETGTPSVVHFTRGGPWFEQWQTVDYGDLWLAESAALDQTKPG